ncbi:glutaredoxin [Ectothiorhodospiraceae bacterium BW-2]|nr:glutaredoxin [Ectothiorhodospiraceae bacterium BW-2]
MRSIRLILKPLMSLYEKVTLPTPITRSEGEQQQIDTRTHRLTLYQFQLCPFCIKVRRTIHRLNLKIEQRNANESEQYRQELIQGGGKWQTPCLRIEEDNGETRWLYESDAIIDYLQQQFAN